MRVSFPRTVHLLILYSFPTRRSSDLTAAASSSCVSVSACGSACPLPESSRYFARRLGTSRSITSSRNTCSTRATRSEEHTSELQSRQYLVCRLLLEKKKLLKN